MGVPGVKIPDRGARHTFAAANPRSRAAPPGENVSTSWEAARRNAGGAQRTGCRIRKRRTQQGAPGAVPALPLGALGAQAHSWWGTSTLPGVTPAGSTGCTPLSTRQGGPGLQPRNPKKKANCKPGFRGSRPSARSHLLTRKGGGWSGERPQPQAAPPCCQAPWGRPGRWVRRAALGLPVRGERPQTQRARLRNPGQPTGREGNPFSTPAESRRAGDGEEGGRPPRVCLGT